MLAGFGQFRLQLGHFCPEPFVLLTQTPALLTRLGFCRFRHTDEIVDPSRPLAPQPLYFVLLAAFPAPDLVLAPGLSQATAVNGYVLR